MVNPRRICRANWRAVPVVGRVREVAFQPMRPMSGHRIGGAAWNRPSWWHFAFLRVVTAIEPAGLDGATCAVVLYGGDAASFQHPFKTWRKLFGCSEMAGIVVYSLE